jgi:hypothetical protein
MRPSDLVNAFRFIRIPPFYQCPRPLLLILI